MKLPATKKTFVILLIGVISLYAAIVSTILLCQSFPTKGDLNNVNFDYMGIIVGILSVLITILIGWNIFSVLDYKRKVDRLEEQMRQVPSLVQNSINNTHIDTNKKFIDRIKSEYGLSALLYMNMSSIFEMYLKPETVNIHSRYLTFILYAISYVSKTDEYKYVEKMISEFFNVVKDINFRLSLNERDQLIEILSQVNHQDDIKGFLQLRDFIKNIKPQV